MKTLFSASLERPGERRRSVRVTLFRTGKCRLSQFTGDVMVRSIESPESASLIKLAVQTVQEWEL